MSWRLEVRTQLVQREAIARRLEEAEFWSEGLVRYGAVLVVVIAMTVVFGVSQSPFFTVENVRNLLTNVAILWVVSVGMTFTVLTGGIDLSVGSMVALAGVLASKLLPVGIAGGPTLLLCLLFGALVGGALNGLLIGGLGLSFFVITLGSMAALQGFADLWSNGQTAYVNSSVFDSIGAGTFLGVPVAVWIMLAVFAAAFCLLRWTYFGRDVYATGGNQEAARLSGIPVARTIVLVYAIAGACAALGGMIQAGQIGAASPDAGADVTLNAAAAVLLGGTSFTGGGGGVVGTAVGVLFIGILQNGLALAGVQSFWQLVVTGAILIAAVVVDHLRRRTAASRHRRRLRQRVSAALSEDKPSASTDSPTESAVVKVEDGRPQDETVPEPADGRQ